MLDEIGGLPVHPLIVHATVVLVPLAAMAVLLAALWPRFRRWAAALPLLLSIGALVLVPLTVRAGEALSTRVPGSQALGRHMDLGRGLLPWVIGVAVVAAGLAWMAWLERRGGGRAGSRRAPGWVAVVLAVAALAASGGTLVQTVLIGHSGATAVWAPDAG